MLRKIIAYGLLAGVLVGAMLFGTTVTLNGRQPLPYGVALGYATMLIALSAVFLGVKRHRDRDLGGTIRFWPAFGMGVAISAVASLLYVLAWEAALAVTQMDFAGDYARHLLESEKAKGASAEQLAKIAADMLRFKAQYAKPLVRMAMTATEILPVGVLVSVVAGALLCNRRFMPIPRYDVARSTLSDNS